MDLDIQKRMIDKNANNVPGKVATTTSFGKKKLNRADYMF